MANIQAMVLLVVQLVGQESIHMQVPHYVVLVKLESIHQAE